MRNTVDFRKRFLTNTDESGRFIVKSFKTGKVYFVEPITPKHKTSWGDLNPATKKVEGNFGAKYTGSVNANESLITKENGFDEITFLQKGSPFEEIERRDAIYLNFWVLRQCHLNHLKCFLSILLVIGHMKL